jgi:hypothetical protein
MPRANHRRRKSCRQGSAQGQIDEVAIPAVLTGGFRERGWISLSEAAHLFSTMVPEYAFGEMDEEGKRRIAEFAAACRCEVQFMPAEGRVYFRRRS